MSVLWGLLIFATEAGCEYAHQDLLLWFEKHDTAFLEYLEQAKR